MKPAPFLAIASTVLLSTACPEGVVDACGLSGELPTTTDVDNGFGKATLSNGGSFDREQGSWAPSPSNSLVLGILSIIIQFDEDGDSVDTLISRGAFPICVRQGERSETSGSASWQGSFVTNANNTGAVSLLGSEDDMLVGRFELQLQDSGGNTVNFTDGVFRVPQR